ncbi:MAG: hypothetical protein ACJAQT_003257 [Akkermansiaceae bacterium]|jgi:hypothetical protein
MVGNDAVNWWDYLGLECYLLINKHMVLKEKIKYTEDGQKVKIQASKDYVEMVKAAKEAGYTVVENANHMDMVKTMKKEGCTKIVYITHGNRDGALQWIVVGWEKWYKPELMFRKKNKGENTIRIRIVVNCCHWDKVCSKEIIEKINKEGFDFVPLKVPQIADGDEKGEVGTEHSFRILTGQFKGEKEEQKNQKK